MYRTNIACTPAGPFAANLIVSMRPMTRAQAQEAALITADYARVHGSPLHVGDSAALGINDVSKPDYGDGVTIQPHEVPVFWACGITPLEAIMHAKPHVAMTHDPGHMFVTDLLDTSIARRTAGA